eukprot:m.299134 g.299134  ORF g.299134 m.299134 type:complete len:912 (+) comp19543_c1_seq5:107-2842(+)
MVQDKCGKRARRHCLVLMVTIVTMVSTTAATATTAQTTAAAAGFDKLQRTCMPWLNPITRVGDCGDDKGTVCNVTLLALACNQTAGCNAFNTNGFLKKCPLGRCGCDSSADACLRGRDIHTTDPSSPFDSCATTDLYVRRGNAAPADWQQPIAAADALYASPEPSVCYSPEVGNGYLATVVGFGAMYVGGLYNGHCGGVHKARLPSTVAVAVANANATVLGALLDMRRGIFARRWVLADGTILEQRIFAHRMLKHMLVHEIELLEAGSLSNGGSVVVNLTSLWDPEVQSTSLPGNGCAGSFTKDFVFAAPGKTANLTPSSSPSGIYDGTTTTWVANTTTPGDHGEIFIVAVVTDQVSQWTLTDSAPLLRQLTSVATSLDVEGGSASPAAVAQLAEAAHKAAAALSAADLMQRHTQAWDKLHASGIDVAVVPGAASDSKARGLEVATHVNSSLYFLKSSIRTDYFPGVSPGGLATQNYQGAVFMDQDWWMEPSLYLLEPDLAKSLLQYRYNSLTASAANAKLFGYNGAMFAWTAAYLGRPFGCCLGKGGYENCLEQHVTPDVGFSAWQYYLATQDEAWLRSVGFPILSGVAEFLMSRVSPSPESQPTPTSYNITGILPIDEWCVHSGCGCEKTGVADDAQMNGASKAALLAAAKAADVLGNTTARSALWAKVGDGIRLLFNQTGNHHIQFDSPTCPDGHGGTHYSSRHTVCPEDVLLLTYPLGDVLKLTDQDVAKADVETFFDITCMENAGMTTPIQTIVWLQVQNHTMAQRTFNRSMFAACYGPFNVRNEVDKHADVVGAHFDNTHFLTGDGGFLQAVLYGYGGLRITEAGLLLHRPFVPDDVATLVLRSLAWRRNRLTVTVDSEYLHLQVNSGPALMLIDANKTIKPIGPSLSVELATFAFPGLIYVAPP